VGRTGARCRAIAYYMQLEHDKVFVVSPAHHGLRRNSPALLVTIGMQFRCLCCTHAGKHRDGQCSTANALRGHFPGLGPKLLQMKAKPFYDPEGAAILDKMFSVAVNKARILVNTSMQRIAPSSRSKACDLKDKDERSRCQITPWVLWPVA